jgi:hypothetical protein
MSVKTFYLKKNPYYCSMKWRYLLMAIYIIAVSLYPCTDSKSSVTTSYASETAHHQHDDSHKNHADTCPPFCVCNCCGVQMVNYISDVTFNFFVPFQTISSKQSFYVSNLSDTYSGKIWQPPQLV